MPRPFERRSETSDRTTPLSKQPEPGETSRLAQLREWHNRLKDAMTIDQQKAYDHQAHTEWRQNEYKAIQGEAAERAKQPWPPGDRMQLTRDYQHRSQHDFSGALAGTLEEARCYWYSLTQAQKEQLENIDTYMKKLYNADASTSQSAEASSQYGQGEQEESSSQSAEASSQHGQGEQRTLTRAEAFGQGEQRALTRKDFANEQAYRNHLARQKGFDNDYQYRNHLAREKGFNDSYDYKNHLAREKGFNDHHDYRNDLAQKSGFDNPYYHQKHSKKRDKSS